jgi:hypothetical protein
LLSYEYKGFIRLLGLRVEIVMFIDN